MLLFVFTAVDFGPFSSVWTATIAREGAFCSIFRDLQDLYSPVGGKKKLEFFASPKKNLLESQAEEEEEEEVGKI